MNRFFSPRFLVAAALATAALGAATVAEARPDVYLSIGFQNGPGWAEPAPVFVQPPPVYVQPRPLYVEPARVYARPSVFVSPREVYARSQERGDDARFEWEREQAWRHRHEWRDEFRDHPGHDSDRDRDHRMRRHDLRD